MLDNDTGEERSYSPRLVARSGGRYAPVGDPEVCPDIAATIRAGQSIPFRLPGDLPAGMYAVALDPRLPQGIVTGLFEVVPAE